MCATCTIRVSGTSWFKHRYLTTPAVTPQDRITAAIEDLTQAMRGHASNTPKDQPLDCLQRLHDIMHSTTKQASINDSNAANISHTVTNPRVPITMHKDTTAPPRVPLETTTTHTMENSPCTPEAQFHLHNSGLRWRKSQPGTQPQATTK